MIEESRLGPALSSLASLFTPTPAASLWKTFGKFAKLVYFLCWMMCLPVELVLHRRVGKRYMNTLFFLLSLVLLGVLSLRLAGTDLTAVTRDPMSLGNRQAILVQTSAALAPFNALFLATVGAFALHYWFNRRRFGTPRQLHSFDFGIPWLVFPPVFGKKADSSQDGLPPAEPPSNPRGLPAYDVGGGPSEVLAYPITGFLRNFRHNLRFHLEAVKRGDCPYGPFTWFSLAVLEPFLLAAAGATAINLGTYPAFGVYLLFVAVALFIKGKIHQAEWREWAYDECDQRLDVEAKRNWREGKPATALSTVFTVPITRAVVPAQRASAGPRPLMAGQGFDHLFPDRSAEGFSGDDDAGHGQSAAA